MDHLIYVIEPDGTIYCLDHQELETYIDEHQNEDFAISKVREDVVQYIADDVTEYMKIDIGVSQGDAEALAFMAHNWGDLYCEVLMSYTTLIQGGMSPGPAAYGALLLWDISLEDA